MNLGKKISTTRKLNNITATDLAKSIGISQSYLSEIENNKKTPNIEIIIKIAQNLNLTVSELLGETTDSLTPEIKELLHNSKNLTSEQLEAVNNLIKAFKK